MAVIECGGVGFKCFTTLQTLRRLPPVGSEAKLFTHMHIREDILDLYGFAEMEELNCFKLLIAISGVGPKAGLAILSEMTAQQLAVCIATGDSTSIKRAPGIGAKLAQRIVLELKDKMGPTAGIHEAFEGGQGPALSASENTAQAVSALLVLGYSQSEAAAALAKLNADLPVEDLIKQALKNLM